MQFGRTYEEFEVGAVYKHWPGKTVTEYDDHLFCLLTMNHHPLHLDAHYAAETTDFGKNVVVGNYIYSLLLGMSVPDVSGKAIANLEIESLKHVAPTFHGDTIYGETTVLGKRLTVPRRPRHRGRRDHGLQAGRHPGLRVPPQGDGADRDLHQGARRRPARPPRARPRFQLIQGARHGTPRADRRPDRHPAGHPGHRAGLRRQGDHPGRHRARARGRVPARRSSRG